MTDVPTLRLAADPAEAAAVSRLRDSVRLKTAAAALDCDPSHIRQLLGAGDLEGHRIGKRGIRIYVDSIEAYQAGRPICLTKKGRAKAPPPKPRQSAAYREAVAFLRRAGAA